MPARPPGRYLWWPCNTVRQRCDIQAPAADPVNAYVQEEIFKVCTWAIPVLALGTAAALLLIAAV